MWQRVGGVTEWQWTVRQRELKVVVEAGERLKRNAVRMLRIIICHRVKEWWR